jgi:hypothetical protein
VPGRAKGHAQYRDRYHGKEWKMSHGERFILIATTLSVAGALGFAAYARRPAAAVPEAVTPRPAAASAPVAEIAVVADAALGGDRWFLVDDRSHRVHVLDSTGAYVRSFGRQGRGPGEFTAPRVIAATALRAYVAELSGPAISVFDSAGTFIERLQPRGGCLEGGVAAMATSGDELYVLRRCLNLPREVRYRVERRAGDGPLDVWTAAADTVRVPASGAVPLHFPLLAVGAGRLVLGLGDRGCLRVFRLTDGAFLGERCLDELPRLAMPAAELDDMTRRYRGRVAMPDSLPRVRALAVIAGQLAAQAVEGMETATWYLVGWQAGGAAMPRPVGRPHVENSFVAAGMQLSVWDEPDGLRIEVARVH